MCWFVTLVLPDTAARDRLRTWLHDNRKAPLHEIAPAALGRSQRQGEVHVRPALFYCDCDTLLGAELADAGDSDWQAERARLVKQAAKSRWSGGKQQRWVEQKLEALHQRSTREAERRQAEDDVPVWLALVEASLGELGMTQVGVLRHFYSGSLDNPGAIHRGEDAVRSGHETALRNLPADTVTWFAE